MKEKMQIVRMQKYKMATGILWLSFPYTKHLRDCLRPFMFLFPVAKLGCYHASTRFKSHYNCLNASSAGMSVGFGFGWNRFSQKLSFQGGCHYCTTSINKAWTQVLRRFKSCSLRAEDLRWYDFQLDIRLNTFRQSIILQKQFIIIT